MLMVQFSSNCRSSKSTGSGIFSQAEPPLGPSTSWTKSKTPRLAFAQGGGGLRGWGLAGS